MRVRLLGTLEVMADDGTVVSVNGAKLRTLLALLALDAGNVVAVDRLIDCLYGDQLPSGPTTPSSSWCPSSGRH